MKPKGKGAGMHTGRVTVRARGSFTVKTSTDEISVHHKYCKLIMRGDGYAYGKAVVGVRERRKMKRTRWSDHGKPDMNCIIKVEEGIHQYNLLKLMGVGCNE